MLLNSTLVAINRLDGLLFRPAQMQFAHAISTHAVPLPGTFTISVYPVIPRFPSTGSGQAARNDGGRAITYCSYVYATLRRSQKLAPPAPQAKRKTAPTVSGIFSINWGRSHKCSKFSAGRVGAKRRIEAKRVVHRAARLVSIRFAIRDFKVQILDKT